MAEECKICKVLAKPGDLCRVLNQGLYHKYTSSQDYFYTRDINALLLKKRKAFCIRYYDDLVFDENKERLKGYFRKKDSSALMHEIKQFYTKFQNFPRNFHTHFFNIINSNIRKHRRLEYMRVFNNVDLDEDKAVEENEDGDHKDMKKPPKDECEFNFMELLGDSFLQDNYKDMSNVIIGGIKLEQRRTSEQLMQEVDTNFKALYKLPRNIVNDPSAEPFSNALYNKNYMLYSRNDSETAEDMLKQIVNEFRDVDFSRKASVSLAEKVLQQSTVNTTAYSRKIESRNSPMMRQRPVGTLGTFDLSPSGMSSKKSLGASNFTIATNQHAQKQAATQILTGSRAQSNLRSSAQLLEPESPSMLGKVNSSSKLIDPRKASNNSSNSNNKFSVEHLNDLAINRNKILSKLYQFRSTRSKSGGLKSVAPVNKSSSGKARRPLGLQVETQGLDTTDPKQVQTAYYINHRQSPSPSPERNNSKDESERILTLEAVPQPKIGLDSPYYNSIKRSISNGRGMELREVGSPTNQNNRSLHKKTSSVIKRTAAPVKQHAANPSGQNFTNNSSYVGNASATTGQDPSSPVMKLINPLRTSLGSSQSQVMNIRHQSPLEDRLAQEKSLKNINIRSLKNTSPNRADYRVGTMSLSGRHQNLSDLSQGMHSMLNSQASVQIMKVNSQPGHRKNVGGEPTQLLNTKIVKRASGGSGAQNQLGSPIDETVDRERKGKRILQLNDVDYNSFKDLKSQSKDQTPSNYMGNMPSSTTSLNKFKMEVKKNVLGSYTVKGGSKDIKFTLKNSK